LAERVHGKKFGCLVLLGTQVDDDVFKRDLFLCEDKRDHAPTGAWERRRIKFEHHIELASK
jgi:hypothetical protein